MTAKKSGRNTELFRLEKTFEIIESNHKSSIVPTFRKAGEEYSQRAHTCALPGNILAHTNFCEAILPAQHTTKIVHLLHSSVYLLSD